MLKSVIIQINDNVKWVNRSDFSYIYSIYTDRYYKIYGFGKKIWDKINKKGILYDDLLRFFDNRSDTIEKIFDFLKDLEKEKLIIFLKTSNNLGERK